MRHAFHNSEPPMSELLGDDGLSLQELARACRRAPEWVSARVSEGVLAAPSPCDSIVKAQADPDAPEDTQPRWRFASTTLVRARRVSDLEACFDADPHLAALTVDLIEEVGELRRQIVQLRLAAGA